MCSEDAGLVVALDLTYLVAFQPKHNPTFNVVESLCGTKVFLVAQATTEKLCPSHTETEGYFVHLGKEPRGKLKCNTWDENMLSPKLRLYFKSFYNTNCVSEFLFL